MDGFDAWNVFVCIFEDFKKSTLTFQIVILSNLYKYMRNTLPGTFQDFNFDILKTSTFWGNVEHVD